MAKKSLLILTVILVGLLFAYFFRTEFSDTPLKKLVQAQSSKVVIKYSSGKFSPTSTSIKLGQMMEFRNTGEQPLQIALGKHPTHEEVAGFEETLLKPGKSYFFTIWKSGIYDYHDHLNPEASGSLIVSD
ncbi:MAG: hypothetical protein A3F33_02070 [Candidatus Woykebacteria bacterium RIFCSPHIGHO2_12_FULL_43_10]|uniref:EfeO-type cupredoxin-like domain-containing protein n=1 Tax=Candidatus Woykebacteria bacterium RIFCSPHIGHO2_02_FULL_43_16b TaxID=1802601 RepID=A0A1G1WMM7_9BACT|nr:MAG: hypothetical protein A2802_01275 [Candidatus Woykebacteria bacterium RIFCSPHIGHO2_01_FULL_43_29]OGY28995.1 MAG: hypothetical protein A3J50_03850 [Candidatus Woykebacteria bacterium RIFCSPHIGHO2_02_FULL_43_16b]OGY29604.1 MAG: hypothetical protein A3F33_02070 [Candidatus Woykebacteria bacterium RIFCSPHIGHO2_12_FULL_43_10]